MAKVKPQVIDDEQHERVYQRVAAVDVAKDSGTGVHPYPAPVPARRQAKHRLDGEGPDGRIASWAAS